MGTDNKKAAFYAPEDFSIGELKFRPFTIATPDHLTAFGWGGLVGTAEPPAEDDEVGWLLLILGAAWTLSAPLEDVNRLAFDIMEAADEAEAEAIRKDARRELLTFRSMLDESAQLQIVDWITSIFADVEAADFETAPRKSTVDADADAESPPGN